MIWCYIIISMFIGIIAGVGYYEVTRSELRLNYELKELVMMLGKTKRNAILIGVIVGIIWPLTLMVLTSVLILVAIVPNTFNEPVVTVKDLKKIDLTNHNIVWDEKDEDNVVGDDVETCINLNLAEVDEAESDNIESTEPNTKD